MEKGQINIDFKKRRIAYNDTEMLVGQATRFTTMSYESVVAYAAKAACVPESSIKLSIEALFDAMKYFVMNGHPVKIPYLGTFYLSVRVKSAATKEEFVANFAKNLRNISVCFLPAPELKARIASTTINTLVEEK